jgi:serine/threonine protein kinase
MGGIMELVGQTLGEYKLLEQVGAGGMGEVYRGQHILLGTYAAIKVILPQKREDEISLQRFIREARAIHDLRHPNIATMRHFGVQDGVYYLVMQWIEGPNLRHHLNQLSKSGQKMSPEEALSIGGDIADALDYAHQRGMIHRDIKPSNIIISTDGEALLTDFGLVKMLSEPGHTQSGAIVGTASYIAPEQIQETPGVTVDHRVDIYSFGCLLFEMLVGKPPFEADDLISLLWAHVNTPPPDPRELNPDIPPAMSKAILKALSKQPEKRQPSSGQLFAELRQTPAQPPTPLTPWAEAPAPRPAEITPQPEPREEAPAIALPPGGAPERSYLLALQKLVQRRMESERFVPLRYELGQTGETKAFARAYELLADHTAAQAESVTSGELFDLLQRYPRLVILGDPGSGKTTTLHHLALETAERHLNERTDLLPVFVSLNAYGDPHMPARDFLRQQLALVAGERSALVQSFDSYLFQGRLAFLLDSLNEMPQRSAAGDPREAQLVNLASSYPATFVVACREQDYGQSLGWQEARTLKLSPDQVQEFAATFLGSNAEALLSVFSSDVQMRELASNPFCLRAITWLFEQGQTAIPFRRGQLLQYLVTALLERERDMGRDFDLNAVLADLARVSAAMIEHGFVGAPADQDYIMQRAGLSDPLALDLAVEANIMSRDQVAGQPTINFRQVFIQDYLAAAKLRTDLESLRDYAEQERHLSELFEYTRWNGPLLCLLGLLDDETTRQVILGIIVRRDPIFAARNVEILNDVDPNVGQRIAEALIEKLDSAHSAYEMRQVAAALGSLRTETTFQSLLHLQTSRDQSKRSLATFALSMAVDQARERHEPLFVVDQPFSGRPAEELISSQTQIQVLSELLKQEDARIRQQAARELGTHTSHRAVSLLVPSCRDPDPFVRWEAADAIATSAIVDDLDALAELQNNDDPNVRAALAQALGRMTDAHAVTGGGGATAMLLGMIEDRDSFVRWQVIAALGELADPQFTPIIETVMRRDPDADVRGQCASTLSRFPDTANTLLNAVLDPQEELLVRLAALRSLEQAASEEIAEQLAGTLETIPAELRTVTAEVLRNLGERFERRFLARG